MVSIKAEVLLSVGPSVGRMVGREEGGGEEEEDSGSLLYPRGGLPTFAWNLVQCLFSF